MQESDCGFYLPAAADAAVTVARRSKPLDVDSGFELPAREAGGHHGDTEGTEDPIGAQTPPAPTPNRKSQIANRK